MQNRSGRKIRRMVTAVLLLCIGSISSAQSDEAGKSLPDSPKPAVRSIEDLNYLGGDAAMPPFSDSVLTLTLDFAGLSLPRA